MDMQLVIKLTSGDGTGVPVGIVESPPMLYTNLKALFPTVTFSDIATSSETEPYWYGVFEWNYPPQQHEISHTKNVKELGLVKNEQGVWRHEFEIVDASAEEIIERTIAKEAFERVRRDNKLKLSDWVDLPISSLKAEDKIAYDAYRQALRDYPAQEGFPWNATFPKKPKE
jgi:hypothetical protein